MSNFWSTQDNSPIVSDGSFNASGSGLALIPGGTDLLVYPDECKWETYLGERFIKIRWDVLSPMQYKGRKVFQKIRVEDEDSDKRDKAMRMLSAIDANAGGKLLASGVEPTDEAMMMCLSNKQMIVKVEEWEMNGKKGNWVCAVSKYTPGGASKVSETPPTPKMEVADEDVPF